MKIGFYADHPYWSQLSNNGGTRTILRSAAVLRELGHKVNVVAHQDKFTWFKHPKPVHRVSTDTDVVIAVTVWDIDHMVWHTPPRTAKAVWLRSWPKWTMPSDEIYTRLSKFKGTIICNAGWLVEKLAKRGIKSHLGFAGMDVDFWRSRMDTDFWRVPNKPTRIGCLYNQTHPTKNWKWFRKLKILCPEYEYFAFGTHQPKNEWLKEFSLTPSREQLRHLYRTCHFWFAPSSLEGFHNVPAEAALAGCLCYCLDRPSGGTGDWATNETAHMFRSVEDAAEQLRHPDFSRIQRAQDRLVEIGNRRENMAKFVRFLK